MTDGVQEKEHHLVACPKCSRQEFHYTSFEFNDTETGDVVHQIVCRHCGFSWREYYEFRYSYYETEERPTS